MNARRARGLPYDAWMWDGRTPYADASMTVPSNVFDQLLAALDEQVPLAPAVEKAILEPRFQNR